jgi:RimJ/RimL family protein N-acetyltransferase
MNITLRSTTTSDLDALFLIQADSDALHMAAFTSKDAQDRQAYIKKWTGLLSLESVNLYTIWIADEIIGCVAKFDMHGDSDITYAINRKHWGQGYATTAVQQFLQLEPTRPLFGRTAFDNIGSQRVLERNEFKRIGENTAFAEARQEQTLEYIYRLDQEN